MLDRAEWPYSVGMFLAEFTCDTLGVNPGERYDVVIDCDYPGAWAFHCHILQPRRGICRDVRDGHGTDRGRPGHREGEFGQFRDVAAEGQHALAGRQDLVGGYLVAMSRPRGPPSSSSRLPSCAVWAGYSARWSPRSLSLVRAIMASVASTVIALASAARSSSRLLSQVANRSDLVFTPFAPDGIGKDDAETARSRSERSHSTQPLNPPGTRPSRGRPGRGGWRRRRQAGSRRYRPAAPVRRAPPMPPRD